MSGTSSNAQYGRQQKPRKANSGTAEWREFVRIDMTDIHKEDLKANPYPHEAVAEYWIDMVANDVKVTIAYDTGNKTYIVSATDRNPHSENAGLTISAHGSTVWNGIQALTYKLIAVVGDRPWKQAAAEAGLDDFG